eukprot:scaffold192360_cov30-Tisochrysis_lutea.AAC.1
MLRIPASLFDSIHLSSCPRTAEFATPTSTSRFKAASCTASHSSSLPAQLTGQSSLSACTTKSSLRDGRVRSCRGSHCTSSSPCKRYGATASGPMAPAPPIGTAILTSWTVGMAEATIAADGGADDNAPCVLLCSGSGGTTSPPRSEGRAGSTTVLGDEGKKSVCETRRKRAVKTRRRQEDLR